MRKEVWAYVDTTGVYINCFLQKCGVGFSKLISKGPYYAFLGAPPTSERSTMMIMSTFTFGIAGAAAYLAVPDRSKYIFLFSEKKGRFKRLQSKTLIKMLVDYPDLQEEYEALDFDIRRTTVAKYKYFILLNDRMRKKSN